MKYAIVIPDGAADDPLAELGGATPFEAADMPNTDAIASGGKVGMVRTVPAGMTPGSDVAIMSVIGYDPHENYSGRAPLEAAARDIEVGPDDLVFRCNFVTISDERMEDFSAGHIRQIESEQLIADLNETLGSDRVRFHAGLSYRNLMVLRDAAGLKLKTQPPHDIPGKRIKRYLPSGNGARELRELMARSRELLEEHEISGVRRDLGENPATSIWLWGEGHMPVMTPFVERFGVRGSVITAVDLVKGIGQLIGWDVIEVEGATAYIDTNYAGKGRAAAGALDEYDLVFVHVEAPDECGHNGDVDGKVASLSQIDEHVIGPVYEKLLSFDEHRILILPDHPTPAKRRIHVDDPVPFLIAGTGVPHVRDAKLTEADGETGDLNIERGWELMEYFLRSGR